MPIYEYICERCSKFFEVQRPMSEVANNVECPLCSSTNIRRHWTPVNTIRAPYKSTPSPTQESKTPFNGIYLEDVTIENCGGGICVENSEIRGKNVKLRRNKTGLRAKNSKVEIKDLKIE